MRMGEIYFRKRREVEDEEDDCIYYSRMVF